MLKSFFRLPPPDQRWMPDISSPWHRRLVHYPWSTRDKDDCYIMWMAQVYGLTLTIMYALMYGLSYALGQSLPFVGFEFYADPSDPVFSSLKGMASNLPNLFLYVIYPYIMFIYFLHINPRKFDVLWHNPSISKLRIKPLLAAFVASLVIIVAPEIGTVVEHFTRWLGLDRSLMFFALMTLFFSFFFAGYMHILIIVTAILIRYLTVWDLTKAG